MTLRNTILHSEEQRLTRIWLPWYNKLKRDPSEKEHMLAFCTAVAIFKNLLHTQVSMILREGDHV